MYVCIPKEKKCASYILFWKATYLPEWFFIARCSEIVFLNSVLCSPHIWLWKSLHLIRSAFQQKQFPKYTSMCSFRCAYMWYSRKILWNRKDFSLIVCYPMLINSQSEFQLPLRLLQIQKQQGIFSSFWPCGPTFFTFNISPSSSRPKENIYPPELVKANPINV